MSGQGIYTTFVPPTTSRSQYLAKLFPGDGSKWDPQVGSTGEAPPFAAGGGVYMTQAAAAAAVAAEGNNLLLAAGNGGIQQGDRDLFPNGVDMTFGRSPDISAGQTGKGMVDDWQKPGDPANSFMPDISSPRGDGTDALDKNVDPQIAATDIVPNYLPTANTANPATTGPKISAANTLGQSLKQGSSV